MLGWVLFLLNLGHEGSWLSLCLAQGLRFLNAPGNLACSWAPGRQEAYPGPWATLYPWRGQSSSPARPLRLAWDGIAPARCPWIKSQKDTGVSCQGLALAWPLATIEGLAKTPNGYSWPDAGQAAGTQTLLQTLVSPRVD